MENHRVVIRPATDFDFPSIWQIFHQVVQSGDTYAFDENTNEEQAKRIWMDKAVMETFVALVDEVIVGTYILKPNQLGRGSHVCNAAFMVDPKSRGLGVGKQMVLHSLEYASTVRKFKSMQFNLVVSTNTNAIRLWNQVGFSIVGTLPKAFHHKEHGFVDAYVMYRDL